MATTWTTPLTWTAAVVTVAQMNQQLRDNTLHLFESKGNVRVVSTIKVAGYSAVVTDGLIRCNGTFTVALVSAATAGASFALTIKNIGTGIITVDPAGAETIDGVTTATLINLDTLTLVSDGANWLVV